MHGHVLTGAYVPTSLTVQEKISVADCVNVLLWESQVMILPSFAAHIYNILGYSLYVFPPIELEGFFYSVVSLLHNYGAL